VRQSVPLAARFDAVAVSLLLAAFSRAAAPQEASGPASEVITTVAGTSLSYHVAEPEELDGIIRDVASHVQVLWVGVEGWDKDILNAPHKIDRLRAVIDLAHKHGMGVAFGLHWHSLLPRDADIADSPSAGAAHGTARPSG